MMEFMKYQATLEANRKEFAKVSGLKEQFYEYQQGIVANLENNKDAREVAAQMASMKIMITQNAISSEL
jgi:hypothetical protein